MLLLKSEVNKIATLFNVIKKNLRSLFLKFEERCMPIFFRQVNE